MLRFLLVLMLLLAVGCDEPAPKATKKGTIVAYTADWCQPCQEQKPGLARLQQSGIKVQSRDCTNGFPAGVEAVPKYVVYDANGKKVGEAQSLRDLVKLLKWLKWLRG